MLTAQFFSHRFVYIFAVSFLTLLVARPASSENPPQAWRPPNGAPVAPISTTDPQKPTAQTTLQQASASSTAGKPISRLPNDHKQVWREYDISPYTSRVDTDGAPPQQAIVDWILRDTGYASWHSDVVAVLSGTPRSLRVYHTPEMQQAVGHIVDRYVS